MSAPNRTPTPKEIATECEKIRQDWTERDELIRSGIPIDANGERSWNVPTCSGSNIIGGVLNGR